MSGVTRGTTNEASLGDVLAVPIGLAVGTTAGVVIGTAKVGQYLYHGAVRVSKKAYGAVQEKAAQIAREQIEQMQAEITRMSRVYGQVKVEILISPPEQILEDSLSLESRQEAALQQFLAQLEQKRALREEYEKIRGLRADVSRQIDADIQEYREKLARLQKEKQRRKAARETELRRLAEQQQQAYFRLLERVQPLIGQTMEALYPEQVHKLRQALKNQERDLTTLDRFENNRTFRELRKKAALFQDAHIRHQLEQLLQWKLQFLADPLLSTFLLDSERKEVEQRFSSKRYKAEKGELTESDLMELNRLREEVLERCRRRDEQQRFDRTVETAKKALFSQGYTQISISDSPDGRFRVLTGTKPDGHRAFVRVICPGVSDESTPHIELEMDDYTYGSEQECTAARQALGRELESLGVYLNFEEVFTHFQGKILHSAVEELRRQLQEKHPEIKVERVNDNLIRINGKEYNWKVNTSLEAFLETIESEEKAVSSQDVGEEGLPQTGDEGLKETE